MRPRICLNMIVRNEAAIIGRCLRSLAGVIDAAVICDTGSTDATPERIAAILAGHGIACELHAVPFVDFSQARNAALDRARASALDFDLLLLCDADMEFVVADPAALDAFAADAGTVRQSSGSLDYDNVRILRRTARARYVGATHEALVVDGPIARVDGLRFIDHADGSNRGEKLARDERLLRAELAREPGNTRAMYYLAQTLADAGRHAEAADMYARRVAGGGWEEERWHARYREAQCRLAAGDEAGFESGCLDAYTLRPSRAEPLVALARHYANTRRYDAALQLAEVARSLPYPSDDRLFVERAAYRTAVDELVTIWGYYSALPDRRQAAAARCEAMAIDPVIAEPQRWLARHNLSWYAQPLQSLVGDFYPVELRRLDVDLPAPFAPMNPSFVRHDGGWLGVVRGVNYRIESGRYLTEDPEGAIRTRNFLVRLQDDLTIADVREIADRSRLERDPRARIRGFEDCRLFRWREAWWCTATVRDLPGDSRATMALLRLDADGDVADACALGGFGDTMHQKNWMPMVDERLRLVYSCGPSIVLDASAADGTLVVELGVDPGVAIEHWRGGPPLLRWEDGWLSLVHEACDTDQGRVYLHRWVRFDADGAAIAASRAFTFRGRGIEYAAGLAASADGATLLVSFGIADREAWLARVPTGAVAGLLKPFQP